MFTLRWAIEANWIDVCCAAGTREWQVPVLHYRLVRHPQQRHLLGNSQWVRRVFRVFRLWGAPCLDISRSIIHRRCSARSKIRFRPISVQRKNTRLNEVTMISFEPILSFACPSGRVSERHPFHGANLSCLLSVSRRHLLMDLCLLRHWVAQRPESGQPTTVAPPTSSGTDVWPKTSKFNIAHCQVTENKTRQQCGQFWTILWHLSV